MSGESGRRWERWPIGVRSGAGNGAAAIIVATVAVVLAVVSADDLGVIVFQFSTVAMLLFVVGILAGTERGVAAASLPFLAGAALGLDRAGEDWGRALVVGLLWYLGSELAWSSIERRADVEWTPAVGRRRAREVITVIVTAAAIGLAAIALAETAPTRTLVVKGLVVLGVVVGLVAAARALAGRSESGDDGAVDGEPQGAGTLQRADG